MANEKDELYGGNPAVMADALENMKNVRKMVKDRLKGVVETTEELAAETATEKVRMQGTSETKGPSLKPYTESFDVKDRAELSTLIEKAKKEKKTFKISRSIKEGFRYTLLVESMIDEAVGHKVGDTVKITNMAGEPGYTGKIGKITEIDDAGQLHGTWGGLALIPGEDQFEILDIVNESALDEAFFFGDESDISKLGKEITSFEEMQKAADGTLWAVKMKKYYDVYKDRGYKFFLKGEGSNKIMTLTDENGKIVSKFDALDRALPLDEAFFFGDRKRFGTKLDSFEQAKELGKGTKWPVSADEKYFDMYIDKGYELFVKGMGKDRIITVVRKDEVINAFDVDDKLVVLEKVMPAMKAMPKMEGAPEEHHHEEEPKEDKGEYDEEGDMAKSDLQIMADAALELHGMLADEENLPEWVQAKITLASDYIDTARDYMKAKKAGEEFPEPKEGEEEVVLEPIDESRKKHWRNLDSRKPFGTEQTKFFRGESGDSEAEMYADENNLSGFRITWDDEKGGYLLTWSLEESKKPEGKKPLEEKKLIEDSQIVKSFNDFKPWSGAIHTWEKIVESNKVDALSFLLEDIYPEGIKQNELNDLLWMESGWVLDMLGLNREAVVEDLDDTQVFTKSQVKEVESLNEELEEVENGSTSVLEEVRNLVSRSGKL
jgi:hypothetical protein